MRRFVYNKLVRDNILDDMLAKGEKPDYRTLSDVEYLSELRNKLLEEAAEIELDDADKLVMELADLQEVIDAMLEATNKTPGDLKRAQDAKYDKVGGFYKRVYIESVALGDDNPWISHLAANPERYPEITENSFN